MNPQGFGFFVKDGSLPPFLVELIDLPIPVAPGTGAQLQPAWFIDPANSTGFASDSNDGKTALSPVLTYNGGVVARWGTVSPTLRQDTSLTWLSTQPAGNADPVIFTPLMLGAVAVLQGLLGAAQRIQTGVIPALGFAAKNRATGQLLDVGLGFVAPIGSLVKNTTVGKASFAWVYAKVGAGTVYALSQPMTPGAVPVSVGTFAEVNSWAVGDTFEVYAPIGINLVSVQPLVGAYFPPLFPAQVQLYHLTALSADGVTGDNNSYVGNDTTVVECSFNTLSVDVSGNDDELCLYYNTYLGAGAFNSAGSDAATFFVAGVLLVSTLSGCASWSFDYDCIIDATPFGNTFTVGSIVQLPGFQTQGLGLVYIAGEIDVQGVSSTIPTGQVSGASTVWGPGFLNIVSTGRLVYSAVAQTAAATFLNAGGLRINQNTSVTGFNPVTGTWSSLIPLTPAALDLAFGAGGFGGRAVNVGGGTITSEGTV